MRIVLPQASQTAGTATAVRLRLRPARLRLALLCATAAMLAAGAAGPGAYAASAGACDTSSVVAHALPAVVNIAIVRVGQKDNPTAGQPPEEHLEMFVGSGSIIDPSGIIVTNKHVIQGAAMIGVTFQDRSEVPAQLIAAANDVDVAVIKVNVHKPLPTLSFGNSDSVQVGQSVIAVGNPLGVGTSVSTGVISALNRDLMRTPFDDFLQTDASINPGNSGGPLLNCAGQIIGVDTALLSNNSLLGSIGIGFAMPSNDVNFVAHMLQNPNQQPPNWVGLHLQDVTALIASSFHRRAVEGAIVTGVDPNSPAAQASFVPGDVITGIDGKDLPDSRAVLRAMVIAPLGAPLTFDVWREGKSQQTTLRGLPWPHMAALRGDVLADPAAVARAEAVGTGIHVAGITPADKQKYGLKTESGVLIDQVTPGSQADTRDLHAGDVIRQMDNQAVTTPEQVMAQLTPDMGKPGRFVALLVQGKSATQWTSIWVGHIDTKQLVAAPLPSSTGEAHDVSGRTR